MNWHLDFTLLRCILSQFETVWTADLHVLLLSLESYFCNQKGKVASFVVFQVLNTCLLCVCPYGNHCWEGSARLYSESVTCLDVPYMSLILSTPCSLQKPYPEWSPSAETEVSPEHHCVWPPNNKRITAYIHYMSVCFLKVVLFRLMNKRNIRILLFHKSSIYT